MRSIDLNCDLGEGFGLYGFGQDEELVRLVTSANIACGFHAGDPDWMFRTVELCLKHNTAIGAHPGYPDLQGFGRRAMKMSYSEIRNMIIYQVGALVGVARALGGTVEHVKPHGELYNVAVNDMEVAAAVIDAVTRLGIPALTALAGSKMVSLAMEKGLKVYQEGYADRVYRPDGTLLSRKSERSVLTDPAEAARQVLKMITQKKVAAYNGEEVSIHVDTICIHGDNENAAEIIREIRTVLFANDIMLVKPSV